VRHRKSGGRLSSLSTIASVRSGPELRSVKSATRVRLPRIPASPALGKPGACPADQRSYRFAILQDMRGSCSLTITHRRLLRFAADLYPVSSVSRQPQMHIQSPRVGAARGIPVVQLRATRYATSAAAKHLVWPTGAASIRVVKTHAQTQCPHLATALHAVLHSLSRVTSVHRDR